MKAFIKLNRKTMTFTGVEFFTGEVLFENVKKIPLPKDQCIIYHGQGNNIHPSLWKKEWFKKDDKNEN